MPQWLIVNASPLIFLWRVAGLAWLAESCTDFVLIPGAVVSEIRAGHDGTSIVDSLDADYRFRVAEDVLVPPVISAWDLGAGETSVLSACLRKQGAVAVLDDGAARQCGRSLGIPIVGTLGIVLAAKRRGDIEAARPVVERLLDDGLYLSPSVVMEALREVDE